MSRPSAWRRLAAYLIDYLVIAAYIALLFALAVVLRERTGPGLGEGPNPMVGQLIGFVTLTLPVILYFAVMHASQRGATVGKRVLRLRVVNMNGQQARFPQTLMRAVVKFLPWEIAHTAIWRIPGWPQEPAEPLAWQWTAFAASMLACGLYIVSLFIGAGRTPYDRVAGTCVVHRG